MLRKRTTDCSSHVAILLRRERTSHDSAYLLHRVRRLSVSTGIYLSLLVAAGASLTGNAETESLIQSNQVWRHQAVVMPGRCKPILGSRLNGSLSWKPNLGGKIPNLELQAKVAALETGCEGQQNVSGDRIA